MKVCSKCGNNNADEAVFCSSCGTPLQQAPQAPQAAPEPAVYNTQPGTYNTDAGQSQGYQNAAPASTQSNPHTLWLILNIVQTLCCCLPLGIVGIVFSAMGMGAFNKGDYAESEKKLKLSKIMFFVGLGLGLVSIIISLATGIFGTLMSDFGY